MSSVPHETQPDNKAIARALARRFLKHGAGMFGMALFITCGFPTMFFGLIWLSDPRVAESLLKGPGIGAYILMLGEWFAVPALVCAVCLRIRPLYTLPITTRRLVNTQLILGFLAVSALHLMTVAYYEMTAGVRYPIIQSLLVLCSMVVIMTGIIAVWLDFRWWRPFVVVGVIFGVSWLFGSRDSVAMDELSLETLLNVEPTVILTLMVAAMICYPFALRGAVLDRCGELTKWPDLEQLMFRLGRLVGMIWRPIGGLRMGNRPYASRLSAQFSYQFWQTGILMPIIFTGLLSVCMIYAYSSPHEWLDGWPNAFLAILMFGMMFTGVVVGCLGIDSKSRKDRGIAISEYLATRPVSDTEIAYSALKVSLASVILTCLIAGAFTIVVYAWAQFQPELGIRPKYQNQFTLRRFLGAATAGWILLGLSASVMLTGRGWLASTPFLLLISGCLLSPVIGRVFDESVRQAMLNGMMVLLMVGTVVAFVAAFRKKILTSIHLIMAGVLWPIAFAVVAWMSTGPQSNVETNWLITILCLSALLIAPLALAPLAVAWNRHR